MKKVFLLLLALAILIGGHSFLRQTEEESVSTDLLFDNVEALAGGESGVEIVCNNTGCVVCPTTGEKVGWVVERSIHK